jgi:hypothetical protein
VKDNLGVIYPSSEYTLAFHPSSDVIFVIVDESTIEIIFELLSLLGIRVNVPFPDTPLSPVGP